MIDVDSNEIVLDGLSMPHSPRLYDGKLWLLDSGRGAFGYLDPATGRFETVAFCSGYARGLAFDGNHAVIGLSLPRESRTFSGLDLDDELAKRDVEARCGLAVIDLASGDMTGWLRIEGLLRELYAVAVLPGIRCPSPIGFKTDEVMHLISIDD